MKHLFFGSVALLALAATGPAVAADVPVRAPVYKAVPAPIFSWSGFYVGGHCGGAWARSQSSGDPLEEPGIGDGAFDTTFDVVTFRDRASGWMCGAQYGHNWQQGNLVYGLESDLGWIGVKKEATHFHDNPGSDTAFTSVKYRWYSTTTARIGFAQNTSLYYLKGGVATARIQNVGAALEAGVIDANDVVSPTKTRWGWAIGGGYEYAFAPRWSIKFEYLYMDFGQYTIKHLDEGDPEEDTFRFRNRIHTGKIGLNYSFGDFGKGPMAGKGPVVTRY